MGDRIKRGVSTIEQTAPGAQGNLCLLSNDKSSMLPAPPVPARRGKCMSRRKGQNPSVRTRFNKTKGEKEYFFQYWEDVPGEERRQRSTVVLGLANQMTKSEAERKKLDFISNLKLNSNEYSIPKSATFADAARKYREEVAPRMLRASTFSVADGHLRSHLEPDWSDTPVDRIEINLVNEWIWKKRKQGLSWVTIKNILRTMQRVLTAYSGRKRKPPFSQDDLGIPERDKLQMKLTSRETISLSWEQTKRIVDTLRDSPLDDRRKDLYSMLFLLASASGLRIGELAALQASDINFDKGTIRVNKSSDQRSSGNVGPCKNVAAYRIVLLADNEGQEALTLLKRFMSQHNSSDFVFHSRRGTPLLETNVLHDGLHPALRALNMPQAGMHAFRRGCNRRWELSGLNPAVLRQQMGHSSVAMTVRYTGEIPLSLVQHAFSKLTANAKTLELENKENEVVV
jgi:integrase